MKQIFNIQIFEREKQKPGCANKFQLKCIENKVIFFTNTKCKVLTVSSIIHFSHWKIIDNIISADYASLVSAGSIWRKPQAIYKNCRVRRSAVNAGCD